MCSSVVVLEGLSFHPNLLHEPFTAALTKKKKENKTTSFTTSANHTRKAYIITRNEQTRKKQCPHYSCAHHHRSINRISLFSRNTERALTHFSGPCLEIWYTSINSHSFCVFAFPAAKTLLKIGLQPLCLHCSGRVPPIAAQTGNSAEVEVLWWWW